MAGTPPTTPPGRSRSRRDQRLDRAARTGAGHGRRPLHHRRRGARRRHPDGGRRGARQGERHHRVITPAADVVLGRRRTADARGHRLWRRPPRPQRARRRDRHANWRLPVDAGWRDARHGRGARLRRLRDHRRLRRVAPGAQHCHDQERGDRPVRECGRPRLRTNRQPRRHNQYAACHRDRGAADPRSVEHARRLAGALRVGPRLLQLRRLRATNPAAPTTGVSSPAARSSTLAEPSAPRSRTTGTATPAPPS
jgi:hypothetical protein